tara:strand:- start:408 stop:587 length:180 start_codon:yes stop_codon:yes gene_type:complete
MSGSPQAHILSGTVRTLLVLIAIYTVRSLETAKTEIEKLIEGLSNPPFTTSVSAYILHG